MKPFISASQKIAEFTPQALLLGVFLAVVMAASNLYLGLYAGMTISASIPAAVLSMGILRGLMRRGTILENNLVQSIAASGEGIASAILYTVPALVIAGVWVQFDFWTTTLISIGGGVMGVIFMIPLRQSHVVEDERLTFPEGVACAEVLKAGEEGGKQALKVFEALMISGVLKFFTNGIALFKGTIEWAFPVGKTALYFGTDVSAALIGVGYIVGFEISMLMVAAGLLEWGIIIPIMGWEQGIQGSPVDWYWATWGDKIRYLGIGAMMVGSLASIWEVRHSFVSAVSTLFRRQKLSSVTRTERNLSGRTMVAIVTACLIVVFLLYQSLLGNWEHSAVGVVIAFFCSFFFVAVSSYMVGLVGSSNTPHSGIVISTFLLTGVLLTLLHIGGMKGLLTAFVIAGVVSTATAVAGGLSQDLKTGYLLGATPRAQQWGQILGVIVASFVMAPVLTVLNESYGIGTNAPGSLKAPQATLLANLGNAIFGVGKVPWDLVGFGVGLGVLVLILDFVLARAKSKVRVPLMAAAVGMYLPLTLVVPLLFGAFVHRRCKTESQVGAGILYASGFVAGEAIAGVLLGIAMYVHPHLFPIPFWNSSLASIAQIAFVTWLLWRVTQPTKSAKRSR